MTIEDSLQRLGMKENEVKVYLSVLARGEPTVGDIEDDTQLHKQLIYNAAERLERTGLLSIREIRRVRRFSVPDPAALARNVRKQLEQAEDLVPRLLEIANQKRSADDIRIYRTVRGVQQYYLETLRNQPTGSEVMIQGMNSDRFFRIFPQDDDAFKTMEDLRVKKKVTWKLLLFGVEDAEVTMNKKRPHIQMRLLPDSIEAPHDIMIWHDRVGLLFYADEPYVLDLAGMETVEGFRQYFNVLWKRADAVKRWWK